MRLFYHCDSCAFLSTDKEVVQFHEESNHGFEVRTYSCYTFIRFKNERAIKCYVEDSKMKNSPADLKTSVWYLRIGLQFLMPDRVLDDYEKTALNAKRDYEALKKILDLC